MGELVLAAIVYGTIIWGVILTCWYVGRDLHRMIRREKRADGPHVERSNADDYENPPHFDPDPELIDHLEGNRRSRDRYRQHARKMRDAERDKDGR